jgi:hypothetical protein
MSSHSYDGTYRNRNVEVVIGFDRRLQYFFMTVMCTECSGEVTKDSSHDQGDDMIVYSNLSDPEAGFARDLTHYRTKLASLGITVPESLFRETEQDAINQVGNRLARHFDDGRIVEAGPSSSRVGAQPPKDAAQQLIEAVNAAGGLISLPNGLWAPVGDSEWIELAEAYFQACLEKGVQPVLTDSANLSGPDQTIPATMELPREQTNFTGYPDIVFPQWLRDLGFEDESWKNDAAARATKRLPNRHIISVWVDYDDPSDREFPETTKVRHPPASERGRI